MLEISPSNAVKNREMQCSSQRCPSDNVESYLVCVLYNIGVCVSSELVVAESVVVIKKLLQMQPEQHSDIIKHMAKLIDNIQVAFWFKLPTFTFQTVSIVLNMHLWIRCRWPERASCGWLASTASTSPKSPPTSWERWPKRSPMRRTSSSCRLSIWLPNCTLLTQNR